MQVDFFLKQRTKFIRTYYTNAITPFETIKSKIENEEEPFTPPYSEDGEPPFLEEWMDAQTSIQIAGRSCVMMLSESLKMYFQTWDELLDLKCQESSAAVFKKRGFLAGYVECLRRAVHLPWEKCPADLSIVEQIILARNISAHHGGDIHTMSVRYPANVRENLDSPLFLHEYEKQQLDEEQRSAFAFLGSELIIERETLEKAIKEVEALIDWMEPILQKIKWGPSGF